jgi:apolipoprotein N-acyltransferase
MLPIRLVHLVACKSFSHFKIREYATINFITKGFLIAFLLSLFIYLDYLGMDAKLFNTLLYPIGLFVLLDAKKEEWFWSGFFIGIFWFYWISLSFRYYGFDYLVPVIIIALALLYGLIFGVAGFFNIYLRAIILVFMSWITPFGFNWLKMELGLVNSFLGVEWWQFLLLIASLVLIKRDKKVFAMVPLILSFDFSKPIVLEDKLKIKPIITQIAQDKKWDSRYLNSIIDDNFKAIYQAIEEGVEVVVLPESAFPLILNNEPYIMRSLKELSKSIVIVTGGLYEEDRNYYNSTYYFDDAKVEIVHKVFLVPFGEEVPLPKFLSKIINDLFFDGAEDYKTAKNPVVVDIKGVKFTNAICFEATKKEMFGHSDYMIATSNNAWFRPSIEATLQNILMQYYSRVYGVRIYHSYNR